ncbi:MAG: acyl-CoA dehydrogenase family protein [Carbonactinosporaceae bacterium]
MDLRYGDEGERFRAELRAWLDENLPAEWREAGFWQGLDPDEGFRMRREWEAAKARAGFAGIAWPREFGGRGGTPAQKAVYDEEMARARAPLTVNGLGLAYLAPTVMAIGTSEQKRAIVKPVLHNEVIWCQGFSEPGAGSDLANVATRAVPDGDAYLLNGQKTWTSNARHADWMFALVRTSKESSRHAGLTLLLIDLSLPGVEVRPLKQMSGALDFGEVFFTDVRVPRASVLGVEGQGWQVAMLLLSFERGASGIGQYTSFRRELDDIVGLAWRLERGARPAAQDPVLRQRIADSVIELELLRLHGLHVLTKVEQGQELGAESSLTKLQWSETHQDLGELFADVAGADHQLPDPSGGIDLTPQQRSFLWSRSETIWGGSSQIQRSIVAERLLGLPR